MVFMLNGTSKSFFSSWLFTIVFHPFFYEVMTIVIA